MEKELYQKDNYSQKTYKMINHQQLCNYAGLQEAATVQEAVDMIKATYKLMAVAYGDTWAN